MLKGRSAIVTGSTSGIGLGIARGLAAAGVNIVINGFGKPEDIEAERAKLETEFGVTAIYSPADMTKPADIAGMVTEAEAKLGSVDILVNNAGIQLVKPIDEFPIEKFDQIIAINMVSNFHAIRAALPGMKKRNFGRIINIASAHGLVASPFKSAYVAAKHGVVGMTKTVALEVAETGITCNAICPGFVRTPLVEAQIDDQAKANNMPKENVIRDIILASQPNKRFVEVEEIAALAVFLSGDLAQSITGTSISIDGGWTAR
ncbi:3-hydroxybutyrate dehydrogenase [Oleomonas cavernae]|uniref:3-hydroxybutyrate dehydrogenase n=1 Tax=Oleomonas cavernae TaxID=2320859 RepID=A0A418WAL6_9PROT|nr:3-hydroxybutyrate dehydrogenase [Oleomonas cavernae]RJF87072.1 3-hydroxybutyrate dehydrogenase [Oleomonas cavernae]